MSVSKMERLTVAVPLSEANALLRRLMKLRAVSLQRQEYKEGELALLPLATDNSTDAAARAARIDAVLPVLAKRSKRKKRIFAPALPFDPAEFTASGEEERAWGTVCEAERILQHTAEQKTALATEEALMQSLLPYLSFKFPLDGEGTRTAVYLLGSLPAGLKEAQLYTLAGEVGFVCEVLTAESTGLYIAAVCHRADEERTLRALGSLGFLRASFPAQQGTAAACFDAALARAEAIRDSIARLDAQLDILAENLTEVEILSDVTRTAALAEENKKSLAATKKCAVITGWCPVQAKPRVIDALEHFTAAYDFESPAPGEDVPILLQNNGFARNFEWVLGMYSYPKYGGFDPTFIMSIFYFLIFGLMFADAGYGLMLIVACFGAVRWLSPREGMKRFLLMFGYCGISCTVFGVLFGSYFGNFPIAFLQNMLGWSAEQMPNLALVPSLEANVAILFDPLQNPMGFLLVSLAFGALHLLVGMAIKAFLLCREGKVLDALFDIGSYWVLFAGIGTVFFHQTAGIILLSVGAGAILLTQGRSKKGVVGKIIGGFGGLYALINYASDLLSYSRILALGLAAGVIGQVVNVLATLGGASFLGFLMLIAVFIIGHVLNLVINVLGTFVHTARLQYIEFFGRFYEDGGTPFRPITVSDKYTEDVSDVLSTAEPK